VNSCFSRIEFFKIRDKESLRNFVERNCRDCFSTAYFSNEQINTFVKLCSISGIFLISNQSSKRSGLYENVKSHVVSCGTTLRRRGSLAHTPDFQFIILPVS
jgi:hypothetical protein